MEENHEAIDETEVILEEEELEEQEETELPTFKTLMGKDSD